MGEPHTSGTALFTCMCWLVCSNYISQTYMQMLTCIMCFLGYAESAISIVFEQAHDYIFMTLHYFSKHDMLA